MLAEVPNQLVSFMKRRGITPNAAAAAAVPPTAGDGGYET